MTTSLDSWMKSTTPTPAKQCRKRDPGLEFVFYALPPDPGSRIVSYREEP